ncbi:unnamed protein product [Lampetra planeri]
MLRCVARFERITPTLRNLHCLPVKSFRIQYKLPILSDKAKKQKGPAVLAAFEDTRLAKHPQIPFSPVGHATDRQSQLGLSPFIRGTLSTPVTSDKTGPSLHETRAFVGVYRRRRAPAHSTSRLRWHGSERSEITGCFGKCEVRKPERGQVEPEEKNTFAPTLLGGS